MVGDDDGEVPPVPIPNTAVKLTRAQDRARVSLTAVFGMGTGCLLYTSPSPRD